MLSEEYWRLLTLEEEYNPINKDIFDRFRYYNSKNRNILEPVISNHIYNQGFRPKYPDNKKFAVCLSHDIDTLYMQGTREYLVDPVKHIAQLKGQKVNEYFHKLLFKNKSAFQSIETIVELEKKYNAHSSFYFLSLNKGERDYNYPVEDLSDIFKYIKKNGSEIGLHGGHTAYNSFEKITEEKKKLENASGTTISGYRNHFLRFKTPETWTHLERADFSYDTTIGYPDMVGFRNGMCYPFNPYDLKNEKFINLLEIPLNVMDGTLTYYMNLDLKKSFDLCKILIDKVANVNGVFTLLWHNNRFEGEMLIFYENILKYCKEKEAWLTSGKEMADWWTSKKYTEECAAYIARA
jgi:hypothetical protein